MFVPLHDHNPLDVIRFQIVTVGILAVNIGLFLWSNYGLSDQERLTQVLSYGIVPAELLSTKIASYPSTPLFEGLTLGTYMFFHAGWMHLIGNMLFLWVFADNIEDAMGHVRFLVFYLACGIASGLAHAMMTQGSPAPLVGASGAVAGVLGAYLVLYPTARVWVLLLFRIPIRIPAYWALCGWIGFQFFSLWVSGDGNNVAWWAHIGGFAAGVILVFLMRRPNAARSPT